jgi:hypothetical protein
MILRTWPTFYRVYHIVIQTFEAGIRFGCLTMDDPCLNPHPARNKKKLPLIEAALGVFCY